ncbi:MAG: acyltransferase [Bacteroidota bacterium]
MEEKKDSVYFQHLDVFRFVAAFMVVIMHSYDNWKGWFGKPGILTGGTYQEFTTIGRGIDMLMKNFQFGVDIFFLISGFLITYLLLREKDRFGKIHIGKFYVRRILRIWPLYFLAIAIAPLCVAFTDSTPEPNYWANILFYNNFNAIYHNEWTYPFAHFWSICIEEHFYLVWPWVIALIPMKKLPHAFFTIFLASIVFRAYTAFYGEQQWFVYYLHTLSRCDALVIGAFFGYMHFKNPIKLNVPAYIRYLVYGLFIFTLCMDDMCDWNSLFTIMFKKYFYLGIAAFWMGNYMFNPNAFLTFKKRSIWHYFGKISYGIYIYHVFIILIVIKRVMIDHNSNNIWIYAALMFSLSLIIPMISYELFEKPFLKLKSRFERIKTSQFGKEKEEPEPKVDSN